MCFQICHRLISIIKTDHKAQALPIMLYKALQKLPGEAVSSGSSEHQHYSGHGVTTTSTTTGEANMFPIVDSANESAANLDIPGPATVEIATEAVADITADESHSISTVTAADGVVGTLKRLASLQHPDGNIPLAQRHTRRVSKL